MSTTPSRLESFVSPSQRTLVVLVGVAVVLSLGVVVVSAADYIDDFEDGSLDTWDSSGYSIDSDDTQTFEGDYSMRWDGSSDATGDGDLADGTTNSASVYIRMESYTNTPRDLFTFFRDSNGDFLFEVRFGDGNVTSSGGDVMVQGLPTDEYFWLQIYNIDTASSYCAKAEYTNGTEIGSGCTNDAGTDSGDINNWRIDNDANTNAGPTNFDYFATNVDQPIHDSYELSGTVTDKNNNTAIEGATIDVKNDTGDTVVTDTTDLNGNYAVDVSNGTYNVTVDASGYFNKTKEVTISGSAETLDFELVAKSEGLNIKTRPYLKHGQSHEYTVIASLPDGSGGENRTNVTADATVTSDDTNVVTIDSSAFEVIATSDTSVNNRTFVKAEWTNPDTGNTLVATQNVTVANDTVNNLKILPPVNRFTAPLGGGTDDNREDRTIMIIIIGTAFAAAVSLIATSLAGLSTLTMFMLMGWIAGYVGDGVAMVTVFTALFIGMNVAGNVDYTVRRE